MLIDTLGHKLRWGAKEIAKLGDREIDLFSIVLAYMSTLIYLLISAGFLLDVEPSVRFLVGCWKMSMRIGAVFGQ